MDVVLFLASIVLIIVGIVLLIKKNKRNGLISIVLGLVAFVGFVAMLPSTEESEPPAAKQETTDDETEQHEYASWQDAIKNIIADNSTPSDRFNELTTYIQDYTDTSEVDSFAKEIMAVYKNGEYLSDVTNDDYMMTMIFKSAIVEKFTDDANIKSFAWDFYQNMKYTYRGEATDSNEIKANEEQMNKALEKMK